MSRLLVVEDDELVVRAIIRALHARYRITTVPSCTSAMASTGVFDAGIFDILLPDGSGLDVAEQLIAEGRVLKALFFSCTTDERMWVRAEQGGVFISKSEGVARLVQSIVALVPPEQDPVR